MSENWTNWAGSIRCTPWEIARPGDEAEVAQAVGRAAEAGVGVRVAGSGHSFTPLVATDGLLLDLDGLTGLVHADRSHTRARARAGTKLHDLGELLFAEGLAMENLGDVNVQALAGALSTGTHGTGRALRNLPSQLTGMRLVLADGSLRDLDADHDPDLLDAARVSLGALGVVVEVDLHLRPAYRLHECVRRMPMDACLEELDDGIANHRHYEFWWYPPKDRAEVKWIDETEADPDPLEDRKGERIDWSHRLLPSVRDLRFHEMEYSVPADRGRDCLLAVRERMRSHHPDVMWPVEYRRVAADDAWLSTAHGRDVAAISLHQDANLPHQEFFSDVEPIFLEHGGRPHWGKVHGLGADQLRARYERFDDFLRVRSELDPDGRFLNEHLRGLFGV